MPNLISYQGLLTNLRGEPLTGSYNIKFQLFDQQTGGTARWTETQDNLSVQNGTFSVILGSTTPLTPDLFATQRYLEVTLLEPEITFGRFLLGSAPYAIQASQTSTIDGAMGGMVNGNVIITGQARPESVKTKKVTLDGGSSGDRSFFIDETGVIRLSTNCGDIWRSSALGRSMTPGHSKSGAGLAQCEYLTEFPGELSVGDKLGIGTTNPTEKLDVAGNVKGAIFYGNGSGLTNLDASNLATGTVAITRGGTGAATAAAARSNMDVPGLNQDNPFTGMQTFNMGPVGPTFDVRTYDHTRAACVYEANFTGTGDVVKIINNVGTTVWSCNNSGDLICGNISSGDIGGGVPLTRFSGDLCMINGSTTCNAPWTANDICTVSPTTDVTSVLIKQTAVGSPTKDILKVTNKDETVKYLRITLDGAMIVGNPATFQNTVTVAGGEENTGVSGPPLTLRGGQHGGAGGVLLLNNITPDAQVLGNLSVNGNLCATGTIGACSDMRFKKDVQTLHDALNNITKLRGVRYEWKKDEFKERNFPDGQQIGLIGQEVEKIYPEVVSTAKDGYKSVDYSKLTPILIEAVKELNANNEKLEARLAELEKVVKSLAEKKQNTEDKSLGELK